ncbi:MAG: SpoIID/LytB domain-containing protein, partial [Treponema sp.]|nr:SpoIID/LytB domain-containing protein [Treponema sp.]
MNTTAKTTSKTASFFFVLALLLFCPPLDARGTQERPDRAGTARTAKGGRTPLDTYYAGRVEESAAALSRGKVWDKSPLAVIYWELGEMRRAAELLEELVQAEDLSAAERDELRLELFYTYCLLSEYDRAAALGRTAEQAVQGRDERSRAEFFFYSALVEEERGNGPRAAELYKRSLDLNKWRPVAWYRRGLLLRARDPKEAENCLRTCWNQDSSFTEALLPLARLLMARQQWRNARDYLITAAARLPHNRDIAAAMAEVRRHAPGGGSGDGQALIRRQISAAPPRVTPAPAFPQEGTIRIGLAERRSLVSVKAGGGFTIRAAETAGKAGTGGAGAGAAGKAGAAAGSAGNQPVLYRGGEGEQIWVEWTAARNGGVLAVKNRDGKTLAGGSAPLAYELAGADRTSIVAGVVNGAPGTNRSYRGALEFIPAQDGMTVVNIVPMEEYLYGVIPSEMPWSWPMEALKAQTIAARSYSIANRGQFAPRGFDLFGTPHSMAYHGVGAEHKNTTAAVDATRGMIMMGGREPLKAYFSANHGGYSEDSLTLWGYDAHMQAVPDRLLPLRTKPLAPDALYRWIRDAPSTYSNVSRYSHVSAYRWEKWVSPEEIRRRLPEDPGEISRIISRGRGISGRLVALEVRGSKKSVMVTGDAIWNAMGSLRSSLFTIRYKLARDGKVEYFVFQGAGYGHGIGLDQHG